MDNSAQLIWNYLNKKEACGVESPKYILEVLTVCDACCKMLATLDMANEWPWAFTDIRFVLFEGAVMFVDQVSVQGKPGTNKSVAQFYVNTSTDGTNFVYNLDESGYQVK